ncbi:MAG: heme-binding domain-containing protein [Bacteroidales bacterium]|jgi:hypothetical protein|nr:heme-binding domain-containing protein [Bacteroidales bacterium]
MKAIKIIIAALVLILIAVQFLPSGIPENKPEDDKSIANDSLIAGPVLEHLRKSCFDCHSNQVNLPWYSKVAPSSWLLAGHIKEGRSYLNFSEWASYSSREKIGLLDDIRDEVSTGKMPLKSYLLVHREARLDSAQISSILKWADDVSAMMLE